MCKDIYNQQSNLQNNVYIHTLQITLLIYISPLLYLIFTWVGWTLGKQLSRPSVGRGGEGGGGEGVKGVSRVRAGRT